MRERNTTNLAWIKEIWKPHNKCDYCKRPIFQWENIALELDRKIILCLDCWEKENLPWIPDEWNWVSDTHWPYLEYYNVEDIKRFKQYMNDWKKITREA